MPSTDPFAQIALHSPHLASIAQRTVPITPEVAEAGAAELAEALDIAMANGGRLEIDFVRPLEVSFNPRPARVGLILIAEGEVRSYSTLAAGVLATIGDRLEALEALPLSESIRQLALNGIAPLCTTKNPEAQLIYLSMLLDRARHLHQASEENRAELWPKVYQEVALALPIAKQQAPMLHLLLSTWHARFARRLSHLSRMP